MRNQSGQDEITYHTTKEVSCDSCDSASRLKKRNQSGQDKPSTPVSTIFNMTTGLKGSGSGSADPCL
jgi:hypothetical protein